jgi:hypothetical protein
MDQRIAEKALYAGPDLSGNGPAETVSQSGAAVDARGSCELEGDGGHRSLGVGYAWEEGDVDEGILAGHDIIQADGGGDRVSEDLELFRTQGKRAVLQREKPALLADDYPEDKDVCGSVGGFWGLKSDFELLIHVDAEIVEYPLHRHPRYID